MKKWITLLMLVALIGAMLSTAQATENLLQVKDIELAPGETVYVRLELTQPVMVDSMGVTYSYDPAVLRPLKSSSTWTKQATTQAFDTANKAGVWMNSSAVELEGRVCSLAFQVVTEEEDFDTQVTVTLAIKNGGIEVGTYTANVRVFTAGKTTEPEVTEPEATEPEATEPEVTEPEATEPEATEPEVTEPEATEPEVTEPETTEPETTEPETTEPEVTEPEVTEPESTEPEVTEPKVTEPEATEPAGTQPSETQPEATTEDKKPTTDHDHDHDHSHDEPDLDDVVIPEKGDALQNVLILLGIAAAVGIGIAVSKKKKR